MSDLNSQLYDPASESSIHLPARSQRTDWHGYWRWNRPTLMASCTAAQDDTVAAHSPAGLVKHEVCRSSACRAAEGWRFGWHWWCVCVCVRDETWSSLISFITKLTDLYKEKLHVSGLMDSSILPPQSAMFLYQLSVQLLDGNSSCDLAVLEVSFRKWCTISETSPVLAASQWLSFWHQLTFRLDPSSVLGQWTCLTVTRFVFIHMWACTSL